MENASVNRGLPGGGASRAAGRRAAFAYEYVKDWNGTQAAIRAGYAPSGAKVRACHLLRRPDVRAKIEKARSTIRALAEQEFKIDITAVLKELCRIGMSDVRRLFDDQGNRKPMAEWDEDTARAVTSVDTVTVGGNVIVTKARMADKVAALEKLGRHLGLFQKEDGQQGLGVLAEVLATIDGRTANLIDVTPAEMTLSDVGRR